MFGLGGNQRIYYCPHPVNLRKSFDGLAGAVQQYIGRDPASGHLFVFFSRNKKLVKMIYYQDGGMCLFAKRLERGQFNLPESAAGKIELEPRELYAWIMETLMQTKRPQSDEDSNLHRRQTGLYRGGQLPYLQLESVHVQNI